MILIDNIKKIRNFNYFLKINQNFLNYNYIFFCYNIKLKSINPQILNNSQIKYYFLKKLKCIKYLDFIKAYLNNSIIIFCMNDLNSVNLFLHELNTNILYCKINNSFYSLNNISNFIDSKNDLMTYMNTTLILLFQDLQFLQNKLKN